MVDDISKLYAKILEEQNEKDSKNPIVENHLIEENESQVNDSLPKEEPFDDFLLKLSEKIAEHLDISEEAEYNQNEEVDDSKNNYGGVPLDKQTTKSSYIEELKKIDKGDKSKLLNKNDNISATISEQVKEEIGKVKTQISRMAIEGGGGSVAVQYANGGIMRGDLNVTGKYLSGGIDLSTLIGSGGSGGGGLSGTTDRLISGTEVFKLNTDGTFNFPNNIITPQDEVILTLESTKVLDGYYNRLALSPYGFFASDHNGNSLTINSIDNEILIDSQNTYYWKFNNKGALEGPFGTLSVSGNLSATGRVYQNGNDLQSEIESISSFATSTKTTVQSNSASWNYQGSDIKALTGGWVGGNAAYTNLVANSAAYLNGSVTDLSFLSVSGNWNSVYTTVQNNSATTWNYQGTDLKNLSANWQNTYSTVQSNSASWSVDSTTDTVVRALTANWQSTYTSVASNSALWNSAYTNLVSNSAAYLSGYDLSFLSVSGNWNSVYTTVQDNSATTWNYQGSDIKAISGNWDSVYTTVLANSATWSSSLTGVAQTIVAQIVNADSVTMNRGDVVYSFGATGNVMSVKLASNSGEATSSKTFGIINGTIAPNQIGYVTFLGQVDKLNLGSFNEGDALYLGSTAGTFTNVKPVAPNHLVYIGVVERANNGNGIMYVRTQNGYEIEELHNVLITSVSAGQILRRNDTNNLWINTNDGAKWDSTYTTVNSNSATTWNYQGTDLKSLSSNWQNTYTTVNSNSANWSLATTINYLSSNNVLLSGLTVLNSVSAKGNIYGSSFVSSTSSLITKSYSTSIGDISNTSYTVNHNLNTNDIVVSVFDNTTNIQSYPEVQLTNSNNITVVFNSAPATNQYKVIVIGSVPSYQYATTVGGFNLNTVSVSGIYNQNTLYTYTNYNDTLANGMITVNLLPVSQHIGVTQHKKVGNTAFVVLSAPSGSTIDGATSFSLTNQYESIGLYSDGSNYFII